MNNSTNTLVSLVPLIVLIVLIYPFLKLSNKRNQQRQYSPARQTISTSRKILFIEDKAKYHETVPEKLLQEAGRKPIRLKFLINPTLEIIDTETALYFEGCLSIDGYVGAVARAKSVRVKALDRNGKDVSYVAKGWHARILQHEVDHLLGKLYIDSMIPQSFTSNKNFARLWRKSLEADIKKAFTKI